uniref:Uncharacterized protein n=1 Tax=Compsopogon caeruleus TaxID=31354 RepID=A0A6T6BKI2_9RHOD|mmetsp:Transcript_16882/g.34975  ORF Transcript_16882/g.34975 Transcript_16882/m.34975 type:complete len:128 (+) Transcript_16882:97-480(+)
MAQVCDVNSGVNHHLVQFITCIQLNTAGNESSRMNLVCAYISHESLVTSRLKEEPGEAEAKSDRAGGFRQKMVHFLAVNAACLGFVACECADKKTKSKPLDYDPGCLSIERGMFFSFRGPSLTRKTT